jgi:hypothetical protein
MLQEGLGYIETIYSRMQWQSSVNLEIELWAT